MAVRHEPRPGGPSVERRANHNGSYRLAWTGHNEDLIALRHACNVAQTDANVAQTRRWSTRGKTANWHAFNGRDRLSGTREGPLFGVLDAPPSLVGFRVAHHAMLADEIMVEIEAKRDVGFP